MTAPAPAVNWDNLPLLLTAAEAAPILRLEGTNSLYIMARQHRIAHVHRGRNYLFDKDALRRGDIRSLHTHDAPSSQQTSDPDLLHLPSRRQSPRRPQSQSTRVAGR